jgi:class II lanthipeptide synthase
LAPESGSYRRESYGTDDWGDSEWGVPTGGAGGTVVTQAAGRRHGWLSGMPTGVEARGFMTGLAGIGYALLRAGFPAEIPSVPLLDGGPRSRTSGS